MDYTKLIEIGFRVSEATRKVPIRFIKKNGVDIPVEWRTNHLWNKYSSGDLSIFDEDAILNNNLLKEKDTLYYKDNKITKEIISKAHMIYNMLQELGEEA